MTKPIQSSQNCKYNRSILFAGLCIAVPLMLENHIVANLLYRKAVPSLIHGCICTVI